MRQPPIFSFTRLVRTESSECHVVRRPTADPDSNDNVGHLDLHFEGRLIHGTLVLEVKLDENSLGLLIEQMDEQLVPTDRDDFIFTVFAGAEIGYYSDSVSESDRMLNAATRADLQDVKTTLAKVVGSHQATRGKLAEHAVCAYFDSLGYRSRRAGHELDALKIDVIAESADELVYVQVKLGAIAGSEMRKAVASIAAQPKAEGKTIVAAIVAREFPKDGEKCRRDLEHEFGLPLMCVQTYQVGFAVPEYKHSLGIGNG